ncbi:MAG: PDZ domain-containing protein [Bacteroidales bacterium]|jgi:carboxyl-terminal processing protease|nr:PDZ domain-containing protein [Bacteroidales bacterium]OQB65027.1 MAG: Carboxy-terminal processing protease CtpB precursor [Bacteroidetes bacterium ADurb.Bin145]
MIIRKILAVAFILIFLSGSQYVSGQTLTNETIKFGRTLNLIEDFYVDSTNLSKITEKVIIDMLRDLDPHSTYISAEEVKEANQPLLGNFEGIGISFNLLRDTIIVIEPIPGGPSEKVGLLPGDRIVTINGEKVSGIRITTTGVRNRLMGPKGTVVNIGVFRKGVRNILDYTIVRDKIPINSLDAAYMLDKETGYVKLNKFAATTDKEFRDAVAQLKQKNMKNLVIDLRNNGGGYMAAATDLANHFFRDKNLLVYLIGRKYPRKDYKSAGSGDLSSARVVVLTDEGSASATEIFAGAIQDWDRGVIIGRRTFGKGLVQNPFYLTDGSMIRLTIARYYTPTGRSIQSPYNEGYDKYMSAFYKRYSDGEMISADSIHMPDSLKFRTLVNGRTVYGGGGIMPDVFMAADTANYSDYYRSLVRRDVFRSFVLEYTDRNRAKITSRYTSFDEFKEGFQFTSAEVNEFIKKGEELGVKYVENQFNRSKEEMLLILKALVASNIWQVNEYYRIINEKDPVIDKALEVISDAGTYNRILRNRSGELAEGTL